MTETTPRGSAIIKDPVRPPSADDVKPDPLFKCPNENLMSRPLHVPLLQPEYHHMDILATIKQEPGILDSSDTVPGYQDWQESPELSEDEPRKEVMMASVEDQRMNVIPLSLDLPQTGNDEININETELVTAGLFMCTAGELEKESQTSDKNTLSPFPFSNGPPVPVSLYRHVTTGSRDMDVENDGNALVNQTVLADSSVMSSHVMLGGSIVEHPGEKSDLLQHMERQSDKKRLTVHMMTHTGERPYKCTECDYASNTKSRLTVHQMRTHAGEKPFMCSMCDYRTPSKWDLVVHTRGHTGEKPFKCSLCDHKSARKSTLRIHMRTHIGEKPFMCSFCDYKATNKKRLVIHTRRHTGKKPVTLYRRVTAGTTEVDVDYSGNPLGEQTILADSSGMRSRVMLEDSNIDNPGNRIHKYLFRDYKSVMEYHLLHSDEKPLNCTVCDYCTSRKSALTRHMRTHAGEMPLKWSLTCTECDYCTFRQSNFIRHMRTHTGEKPFKCSLCDHRAATKSEIVSHMRTHTGERPFECSICDYRAAGKRELVVHTMRHTGEKPFRCSLCDYKAASKQDVVRHSRTHTGERPHKCKVCDRRFSDASNLTAHMVTHTGEKPLKCTECDYCSSRKSNLVVHMRKHTDKKAI